MPPVHDLAVSVVAILGAERRPADQALEHDGTQRPPIAIKRVTMASEDFRSNIIWCTDGRVGHQTSGASPVIDLCTVADRQVDLVNSNRVAVVARLVGFALEQLCVVVVIMELVEAGRETEICKLDMTTPIKKDVVWLDISVFTTMSVSLFQSIASGEAYL